MHVRTRYFFAGGSARCPLVKEDEYLSDAALTFFWMADMFEQSLPSMPGLVGLKKDLYLHVRSPNIS